MMKNSSLNSVFFLISSDVHLWVFKDNSNFEGVRYSSNLIARCQFPVIGKVREIAVGFSGINRKT